MNKTTELPETRAAEGTTEDRQKLAYLTELLERQLEKLRRYDLDGAVQLAEESHRFAEQLAGEGILERPEYAACRQTIQGLYQDICLVIAAERQEVADKLRQIREGIRTLSAYGK
ncbi:MAG: hypothetical protein WHS88_03735 [Anaerohalosphaeraceae bacterium]